MKPRQSIAEGNVYLTVNGSSAAECIDSTVFSLSLSGLLSTRKGEVYSTNPGVLSQYFAPNATIGNITTGWELEGAKLQWRNRLFLGVEGNAQFCYDPSNSKRVVAYFLENPPDGCVALELIVASSKSLLIVPKP